MNQHLLNHRHLLQRNLHAQIAARHHDAVAHAQNFVDVLHALHVFNLGDDGDICASLGAENLAHIQNILRAAREGGGHKIHAVAHAKGDVLPILLAQVGHAQLHIRHVNALAVGDYAVVVHRAYDLAGGKAAHRHAHQAVVDEDGGSLMDIARQLGIGDGGALRVAHNALGAQRKGLPLHQLHLAVFKRFQADFRALGIQHNGNGQVQLLADGLDAVDVMQMRFVRAMGKVQPGHIHAGEDQLPQDRILLGGRAQRAYDLGFAMDHVPHPFFLASKCKSCSLTVIPPA